MQRSDHGHDLMQKITSANRQKASDSNILSMQAAFTGVPGALGLIS
jgi:hypothetical protein